MAYLWSHVFGSSAKVGGEAVFAINLALTHAEVYEPNVSHGVENNVVQFEVAIDDGLFVKKLERAYHFGGVEPLESKVIKQCSRCARS